MPPEAVMMVGDWVVVVAVATEVLEVGGWVEVVAMVAVGPEVMVWGGWLVVLVVDMAAMVAAGLPVVDVELWPDTITTSRSSPNRRMRRIPVKPNILRSIALVIICQSFHLYSKTSQHLLTGLLQHFVQRSCQCIAFE